MARRGRSRHESPAKPLPDGGGPGLTSDEVLERLPLNSRAFSARYARGLVDDILGSIEAGGLVEPHASYRLHDIDFVSSRSIGLKSGLVLNAEGIPVDMAGAQMLVCAVWSIGSKISGAVSGAFTSGDYLRGFVMDEIATLILFRLGENLFEQLAGRFAVGEMQIGRALAPGDGYLGLAEQQTILQLAGGGSIGVGCARSGFLSPLKSASALAPLGCTVAVPCHRWSCTACDSGESCRLRSRPPAESRHGQIC